NYDSFTYNLVQAFGTLGAEIQVFRNDKIMLEDIERLRPDRIVISPGPGTPYDGGISLDVLATVAHTVPTLGVCLGHRCWGQACRGKGVRAPKLMRGASSEVSHQNPPLLTGVPGRLVGPRCRSLSVEEPVPADLKIIACAEAGEVMGLRHKTLPIVG